jgi:hypothetical protein
MPLYRANHAVGARVRIAPLERLSSFRREGGWRFHHPVQDDQLPFAGLLDTVKDIGYYHGGDVLYTLEHAPGIWHEELVDSN